MCPIYIEGEKTNVEQWKNVRGKKARLKVGRPSRSHGKLPKVLSRSLSKTDSIWCKAVNDCITNFMLVLFYRRKVYVAAEALFLILGKL